MRLKIRRLWNMPTHQFDPTPEMLAFYQRRTNEHIERVRRCLALLAEVTDYGDELLGRARVHDASKFDPEERIPYVCSPNTTGAEGAACRWSTLRA
jgi:hypothetical protein